MEFEYSPDWYKSVIDDNWLNMGGDRLTVEGLKKWYECDYNVRYKKRINKWFSGIDLKGKGLELGFQCGKTTYWINSMYPDVVFDILDWNENLKIIESQLREISNIDISMYQDCQNISLDDGYYDFILSIDFYEHLTEEIYFNSIIECRRLLVDDGRFYVFIGKGEQPPHINLRPIKQLVEDVVSRGFILERQVVHQNNVFNIFKKDKHVR